MIPKFFGETERQLFSVYHPAVASAGREGAVVLCHAGPQDYRFTHWAFRKLAILLAKEGMHVLRFDYYATGDSTGESVDGSLAQWTGDIGAAVQELKDITGLRRVSLVGMRLGAALAARASAAGLRVRDLVLWEPVIDGSEYLSQLAEVQTRWLSELHYPQDNRRERDELLGYPLVPEMREAVESIDLIREGCGAPERLLVIGPRQRAEDVALVDKAKIAGVEADIRIVADAELYRSTQTLPDTLLAHNIPATIAAYLARRK